jgi:hypothetical protein
MSAMQRGSSHNPLVAKTLRLRRQAEAAERARRLEAEARKEALREHGRRLDQEARERKIAQRAQENAERRAAEKQDLRERGRILDQIETCYRQYTPQQQKRQNYVSLDELFDAGAVEWQNDTLVVK